LQPPMPDRSDHQANVFCRLSLVKRQTMLRAGRRRFTRSPPSPGRASAGYRALRRRWSGDTLRPSRRLLFNSRRPIRQDELTIQE
jgi:hypothetical protein